VEILDTAGQDEYTPLRETFMHTGDGFLLVYSIVDDQTLEELRAIREQILRVHRDRKVILFSCSSSVLTYSFQVPMFVIGNKADMAKNDRAVSKEEGKSLAEEFGASFLEVSVGPFFWIYPTLIN
jgi:GTPase KRas protein